MFRMLGLMVLSSLLIPMFKLAVLQKYFCTTTRTECPKVPTCTMPLGGGDAERALRAQPKPTTFCGECVWKSWRNATTPCCEGNATNEVPQARSELLFPRLESCAIIIIIFFLEVIFFLESFFLLK